MGSTGFTCSMRIRASGEGGQPPPPPLPPPPPPRRRRAPHLNALLTLAMVLVLIGEALLVTVLAEAYVSYYTMRPLLLIYGAVFAVLFIATVVSIIFITRHTKF